MLRLLMSPRVEDNGSGNQFVWGKEKTGRCHLNRGELNVFVQLLSYLIFAGRFAEIIATG